MSTDAELRAIRAYAKEAIVTTNAEGIVNGWNPAAEHLFGYGADEIIGKPAASFIPEENRRFESEIFDRTRRGERTVDYETRRVRKDRRVVEVSLTSLPISDSNGLIAGTLCIFNDLGPRRRLELAERDQLFLGTIVSSADDAIVSKDLNGIVTSWNKGAERLFGYTAEEMIGRPIHTLVPPDHPDEEPQILERIRRGERIVHYETKRRRKDGQIIDVSVTISPIRDGLGRIIGASKIARAHHNSVSR